MPGHKQPTLRHLVLVLGDQLDAQSSALDGFDPAQDAIWMAEVAEESTHVPSSKQRIAVFLSAMRHFAEEIQQRGWRIHYRRLEDPENQGSLFAELRQSMEKLKPQSVVMCPPGEWRVWQGIQAVVASLDVPLEVRDDRHFYTTVRDFKAHAQSRKQLRLEYFYRELRQRHQVLMDGKQPVGGQWNFDADNRQSFGKQGPGPLPAPTRYQPDAITQAVIQQVNQRFAHHPGTLDTFGWPVTRAQALNALHAFIEHRLPHFGPYQDAMWSGEAWLYHSHLSCALNLKLIHPREVLAAAEAAYHAGKAPLSSVEGFVRQILGWREYVRGIYWTHMPNYLSMNTLQAQARLPEFFWTGDTDMACLRDAFTQTLAHGYAHHIQRLMVTGLYGLLLGVQPQAMHAWYLSVYVDAVEWVELPNTLGMSQYADGGLMASKPYVASGKYIERMGNHCQTCAYRPSQATGDHACPFTTLYWDFLGRHADTLARNPRMLMQLKNLHRLSEVQRKDIAQHAAQHRLRVGA